MTWVYFSLVKYHQLFRDNSAAVQLLLVTKYLSLLMNFLDRYLPL